MYITVQYITVQYSTVQYSTVATESIHMRKCAKQICDSQQIIFEILFDLLNFEICISPHKVLDSFRCDRLYDCHL